MKRCIYCILIMSVCAINAATPLRHRSSIEQHLYDLYKALAQLKQAADPFHAYQHDSMYHTLRIIKQSDSRLYSQLHRTYWVIVEGQNDARRLSDMPIFSLLQSQKLVNLLLYGTENGEKDLSQKKRARRHFRLLINLLRALQQSNYSIDTRAMLDGPREYHDPDAFIAWVQDTGDAWWSDDLQYFKRIAKTPFVEEVARSIDEVLNEISQKHENIPIEFAIAYLPQFIHSLAQEGEFASFLTTQQGKDMLYNIFEQQIRDFQQDEQDSAEESAQTEESTQAEESTRSVGQQSVLSDIRAGPHLRRVDQEQPWWESRLTRFAQEVAEDMSEQELQSLLDQVHHNMRVIEAFKATKWFQDNVFEKLLDFLREEDIREEFIDEGSKQKRKYVFQDMEKLTEYTSESQLSSSHAIIYNNFRSSTRFTQRYNLDVDDE